MNRSTPWLSLLVAIPCGCVTPAPGPQHAAVSAPPGCTEEAVFPPPAMPRSLWEPMDFVWEPKDFATATPGSFPWEPAISPVVVGAPLPPQPGLEPAASPIPNAGARPEYLIDMRPVPTEVRDNVDP